MEAVTLCGLAIVAFGLWIELEPVVKALWRAICRSGIVKGCGEMGAAERKSGYADRLPQLLTR